MQSEKKLERIHRNNSLYVILVTAGVLIGLIADLLYGLLPIAMLSGALGGMTLAFLIGISSGSKKVIASPETEHVWPVIEVSAEDVKKAVRAYSEKLPKGVYRTILVKEDNSIDAEQLAPFLKGLPSRKFYMSKETYDIFGEDEKEIAITIDKVQKAVDLYVKEHKEFPMLPYDPLNRVNYYQLLQAHCLDTKPEIELYITNYDGLVTHIKPKKNSTGN
ncbi:DUF3939 domain-containing protein [Mesobacillus subterraneus]|uniref:DUF3939 domain-containing protein n=1 Tax=Mesobacillus subterraneus TaxID=285983 RepID=A0A427TXM4_9BACI|nr:DUF3939 domain-containing protein [Mesobacillus subterraneus]RSD29221.1 DUF3939 domain-containing protein [Mesobacillus subterraneus]